MADIRTLLDELIAAGPGKKLQIPGVADERDYQTIRTALVKKWTATREILCAVGDDDGVSSLALCADYDSATCTAIFYIGKSRRREPRQFSFTIIEAPAVAESINDSSDNTTT